MLLQAVQDVSSPKIPLNFKALTFIAQSNSKSGIQPLTLGHGIKLVFSLSTFILNLTFICLHDKVVM
jgi:hypothetical protein